MTRTKLAVGLVALALLGISLVGFGRGLNAQATKTPTTKEQGVPSDKDQCIRQYAESFNERNIAKYVELLHPDFKTYRLERSAGTAGGSGALQDTVVEADFQKDTLLTRKTFERAPKLHLKLGEGTWSRIDSFRGETCIDCWQTVRELDLTLDTGTYHSPAGFVVTPYEGKWKILAYIEGYSEKNP
jgi:hypothetical protein